MIATIIIAAIIGTTIGISTVSYTAYMIYNWWQKRSIKAAEDALHSQLDDISLAEAIVSTIASLKVIDANSYLTDHARIARLAWLAEQHMHGDEIADRTEESRFLIEHPEMAV